MCFHRSTWNKIPLWKKIGYYVVPKWPLEKWMAMCITIFVVQSLICVCLLPHKLQHTRLPHPSLSPWVCSNSCPLSHVIESVTLSNHLILCHPLLLLPSIFPSIRVFPNESAVHISWPKYWNFSFSTRPSKEYSGLISFRIDWFDLLAVQGSLMNTFKKIKRNKTVKFL